ncbi:VCBS repeat-containing protein [Gordonia oryzae]|uniref:VCBS repeat-containing protein n=2 Tax=Gordonia oryzae TaxID=2487349 RepID=A0A3N4G306_9ACTN|nr:VCBS repeat-containing protein [Gordonia oryzae]
MKPTRTEPTMRHTSFRSHKALGAACLALLACLAPGAFFGGPARADTPVNFEGPAVPATADLNHDGMPDIVFSNFALGNGISVFLGQPGGGFRPAVHYHTGGQADYVAIADLNHDGLPDLAVTNFTPSTVSILIGRGDGSFEPAVDYPTGPAPGAVVATDLNHDGNLDLATSNQSPSLSVLLGHGEGTLGATRTVSTELGTGSGSLDAADFDGDGNVDLLRGNYVNSTIQVFRGLGDGGFQRPMTLTQGGLTAWYGLARDVNGDHRPDIVFSNLVANTVSIRFNQGGMRFSAPQVYPTGGVLPQCFDFGDVNGDGIADLVVADAGTSSFSVLLGTGGGRFGPPHVHSTGGAFPLSTPLLGDFNADHKLDVVIGNTATGNVVLRYGDGAGGFGPALDYPA